MIAANAPNTKIHGGRLIDPANQIDQQTDLFIAQGKVVGIGTAPDGFQAEHTIDATGLIVIPGLIDLCAHMREPGHEHKATIDSESHAAAAGGITTLACPPDTNPIIDTPAVIELIRHRSRLADAARVLSIGALTQDLDGEHLSEMAALKAAGCVGISNAGRPLASTLVARRTFEYAATFGLTVFLCPNDEALSANGCVHEGKVATRLGLPGIPEAAETVAVARDLALIEQTGARAHFCHLTTKRALRMVARARYDGAPVTADTAIPYLYLTEFDAGEFDSNYHVIPPLRTQEDRDGLRIGLGNGDLVALCSDHQPHEADAKLAPFPSTEPGISGLDSLLPLALRLAEENCLSLSDLIARLTCGPASILNIPYGQLGQGATADICIFDPKQTWTLNHKTMHSRGKNTPFIDWEMTGQVRYTLRDGKLIYSASEAL